MCVWWQSTTVVRWASGAARPVSCELSGLEVFSCVLGLEDETALAIVEPATLHAYIDSDRLLHVTRARFMQLLHLYLFDLLFPCKLCNFHKFCNIFEMIHSVDGARLRAGVDGHAEPAAVVPRHAHVRGHAAVAAGAGARRPLGYVRHCTLLI